jgi:integrase
MGRKRLAPGQHGAITWTDLGKRTGNRGNPLARWHGTAYYTSPVTGKRGRATGTGTTNASAQTRLEANMAAQIEAERPKSGRDPHSVTVGALADEWLAGHLADETHRPRTKSAYSQRIRCYIKADAYSGFAGLTIAAANQRGVIRKHLQQVADEHGDGAFRGAAKAVKGVFQLAVDQGIIATSAAASAAKGVKSRTNPKTKHAELKRERSLTRSQRDELIAKVRADKRAQDHDFADLVEYLAFTGLRIDEALNLKWEDLDLGDEPSQHVRGTKNAAADATTLLPERTANLLRGRRAAKPDSVYVFPPPTLPGSDKPRDVRNLNKKRELVFRDAGYPWASFHTFRHTVPTILLEQGVSAVVVKDYMRHKDIATTYSYVGKASDTRSAIQAINAEAGDAETGANPE